MQKEKLLVVAAAALVAGCSSEKAAPTGYEIRAPLYARPAHAGQSDFNFNTHLTGDEETPPNDSPAQGQAVLRVSDDGLSVDAVTALASARTASVCSADRGGVGGGGASR